MIRAAVGLCAYRRPAFYATHSGAAGDHGATEVRVPAAVASFATSYEDLPGAICGHGANPLALRRVS